MRYHSEINTRVLSNKCTHTGIYIHTYTHTHTHTDTGYVPARPKEYCHEQHGCGERSQHFTMVFNTFVWMQLFNEINARKIHNEKNQFHGFMYNNMFLAVMIFTSCLQVLVGAALYVYYVSVCLYMHVSLDVHPCIGGPRIGPL